MKALFSGLILTLTFSASSLFADLNLVTNGSFESTLTNRSSEFGDRFPAQQVTGWTTTGYNFVFKPGTADTTYANSEYGANDVGLYGPGNGSNNGLPSSSPDGGNFLGMDGAYFTAPISQTINGLTSGVDATVSFYWAGGQQYAFGGNTTEQFAVSLGSDTQYTPVLSIPQGGFSGWRTQSFTFTPTSSSEVLQFLAIGTPNGSAPPFNLLDGVTLTSATPEPGYLALVGFGLAGMFAARKRFRKSN